MVPLVILALVLSLLILLALRREWRRLERAHRVRQWQAAFTWRDDDWFSRQRMLLMVEQRIALSVMPPTTPFVIVTSAS